MRELEAHHRISFAREFQGARAGALKNAEAFDELLFALERFGSFLTNSRRHLGHYKDAICNIAEASSLFKLAAEKFPECHVDFRVLYDEVREARNDAVHLGTAARHLARHAHELALIVEDALMNGAVTANEIMVPGPVCAELWQPLSAIRRTMLLNSFSYLPYQDESGAWKLVSDCHLVQFLRRPDGNRANSLLMPLEGAVKDGLKVCEPYACPAKTPIIEIAARITEEPCLIMSDEGRLIGIVTAFDLL